MTLGIGQTLISRLAAVLLLLAVVGSLWHCSEDDEDDAEPTTNATTVTTTNYIVKTVPAPVDVHAEPSPDGLVMTWVEVLDAVRYEVRRKKVDDPEGAYVKSRVDEHSRDIVSPPLRLYGMTAGTEYIVQLRAVDADGRRSKWSTMVRGFPLGVVVPRNLAAEPGSRQLKLTWNAVALAEKYELRYKVADEDDESYIELRSNPDGSDITATTFTITGLTNEVEYKVQVRSIEAERGFRGDWHVGVNVIPNEVPSPTNIASTSGDERLRITWDEVGVAQKYYVRYRESSSSGDAYFERTKNLAGNDITETNVDLDGLKNGRQYKVQVRSVDASGRLGEWSSSVLATPVGLSAPANFELVSGTNGQAALSWDRVVGSAKYELRYRKAGNFTNLTNDADGDDLTNTSFTIFGLENYASYDMGVRAVNAIDQGSDWASITMVWLYDSSGPQEVVAFGGDTELKVSWEPHNAYAMRYELRYKLSTSGDAAYTNLTAYPDGNAITGRVFVLTNVANGRQYKIQVRSFLSVDGTFKTEWSEAVTGTPSATVQPPLLRLVTNTGNDEEDAFTTDSRVRILAPEGAVVALSVTTNGDLHTFSPLANEITMPTGDRGTVAITSLIPAIVPTGSATNVVSVTGTATKDGNTSPASEAVAFTLVAPIMDADLSSLTLALEEDTGSGSGNDADNLTTNPNVVIGGAMPTGASSLSFSVITNGEEHGNTVDEPGTNDFGVAPSSEPESISVVILAGIVRYGHTHHSSQVRLDYTLIGWPSSLTVNVEDDGDDNADGLTTHSVLEVGGFVGLGHRDALLTSYVITNTTDASKTTNNIPSGEQPSLTEDFELDMRRVKNFLPDDEKILSITFGFEGHRISHTFNPPLQYSSGIFYSREFSVPSDSEGIAVTTNGIVLIASTDTDRVHFFDTNGNPTTLDLGGSSRAAASNFGGLGSANHQFGDPLGIAVDSNGLIYVADNLNDRIQVFGDGFTYERTLYPYYGYPYGLKVYDGHLYSRFSESRLIVFDLSDFSRVLVENYSPNWSSMAFDKGGDLHLTLSTNDEVVPRTGNLEGGFSAVSHSYNVRTTSLPSSGEPFDIVVGPTSGRLYVSDLRRHQVLVLSYDGGVSSGHYRLLDVVGNPTPGADGSGAGEFNRPRYMVIHNGELYVVDQSNDRVQVFRLPE